MHLYIKTPLGEILIHTLSVHLILEATKNIIIMKVFLNVMLNSDIVRHDRF